MIPVQKHNFMYLYVFLRKLRYLDKIIIFNQNIFLCKIMFFYVKNIYNALKINKILRGPVCECRDAMHRVSTPEIASLHP